MKSVKKKQTRIIPGFGLSMGITITILSVVVLIPLASLIIYTAKFYSQIFFNRPSRLCIGRGL